MHNCMAGLQKSNNEPITQLCNLIEDLKKVNNSVALDGVVTTAYLMSIDKEKTVVIAENIGDAMDKADESGAKDYEMIHHRSFPVLD